jgi:hypothetical protein
MAYDFTEPFFPSDWAEDTKRLEENLVGELVEGFVSVLFCVLSAT